MRKSLEKFWVVSLKKFQVNFLNNCIEIFLLYGTVPKIKSLWRNLYRSFGRYLFKTFRENFQKSIKDCFEKIPEGISERICGRFCKSNLGGNSHGNFRRFPNEMLGGFFELISEEIHIKTLSRNSGGISRRVLSEFVKQFKLEFQKESFEKLLEKSLVEYSKEFMERFLK